MTRPDTLLALMALICLMLVPGAQPSFASSHTEEGFDNARRFARIAVLMASDQRQETLDGFQSAMAKHGKGKNAQYEYIIRNAGGDRDRLADLAGELVAEKPDIAIACGGIEADALKAATQAGGLPVVFLAASSSVERGLVASMARPGGNVTGIDTNDTMLTEKRLWYISRIWPAAQKVLIFHDPAIPPSVQSVAVARAAATDLGLELNVVEVADYSEIEQAAAKVTRADADVILLLPVATTDAAAREVLLPLSLREKIPIMGYNEQSINRGAVIAYGSSRRMCGEQAADLAIKILHGRNPAELPTETPDKLNLTINRQLVNQLGLTLSKRIWRLANQVVDETF